MPQFETAFYIGQIFWMLISFGFLYVMMTFLICPMIEEVLDARRAQVAENLNAAEKANSAAESLHKRYEAFMQNAETEKNEKIQTAYAEISRVAQQAENAEDRLLRRKVRQTEHKIDGIKNKLTEQTDTLSAGIAAELCARLTGGSPK